MTAPTAVAMREAMIAHPVPADAGGMTIRTRARAMTANPRAVGIKNNQHHEWWATQIAHHF